MVKFSKKEVLAKLRFSFYFDRYAANIEKKIDLYFGFSVVYRYFFSQFDLDL